ncbi:hypothetical protein, variant [Blastomyces gilchristii SLH14081]|uniref:Uncharacterized protein n=1 Tax=Blastomyces gilchristii (strain SLH14081) TaxID=559298 RepID=A0A179UE04_BLAGS|nr:uncharacterized protein BDBG_02462 [Blastomyces gilchristii SLH14081]XP_031577098.1 hypothetical protein, variant [Blastomyces gilchristii SLH14081]OAT06204.1 hypothetical protein BDBG_02462 [Blastomyces gilchristii SLH14081]OAT06205.1 hypothetical protein, variant [Blastomyces gilchristii SLH14081]
MWADLKRPGDLNSLVPQSSALLFARYSQSIVLLDCDLIMKSRNKRLKEIGRYEQFHLDAVLETYTLALFTRVRKWDRKEISILVALLSVVK